MKFTLSHQARRETLLAALLDINIGQFSSALEENPDLIDRYGNGNPVGNYIIGLTALSAGVDSEEERRDVAQLNAQAIATMSDQTLHEAVRVFGTDPLPDIKYTED